MDSLLRVFQQQQRDAISKPLLEFKAGKMNYNGTLVEADKRRGRIVLRMKDDLLHFEWSERANSNNSKEDYILFPGSASFKRVKKAEKDRVYCLELPETKKYMFFWMQEPSAENDTELARKVNEYIEKPPSHPTTTRRSAPGRATQPQETSQQQQRTVPVDQLNQILQQFGIVNQTQGQAQGSIRTGQSSGEGTQPIQSPPSGTQGASSQEQRQIVSLSDILNSEALVNFLRTQEEWKGLVEHLPEGTSPDTRSIEEHATSPQFQYLLNTFNSALQTGQLDGLLKSLGLEGTHLTSQSFLEAINKKYGPGSKDDKDNDEMNDD